MLFTEFAYVTFGTAYRVLAGMLRLGMLLMICRNWLRSLTFLFVSVLLVLLAYVEILVGICELSAMYLIDSLWTNCTFFAHQPVVVWHSFLS